MLKIAHLSDLHFSKIHLNLSIFLSKRFIGIFNLLINRRKAYCQKPLYDLPQLFKYLGVKNIFITGDLTSTSLEKEFEKAKHFIDSFDKSCRFTIIPGNHDQYTKAAYKQGLFYKFFKNNFGLNDKRIEVFSLSDKWQYIGLDTCLPTHLFACSGLFSEDLEKRLIETLEKIPKDKNILLVNHFPIIHDVAKRKILKRREFLNKILKKYSNIKLYLHGHTHICSIKKEKNLPYMICSGCATYAKNASFNILELEDNSCTIITYIWRNTSWQKDKTTQITF
jgi:3',5'-cyclic AMP phosphodiesterase CpdA